MNPNLVKAIGKTAALVSVAVAYGAIIAWYTSRSKDKAYKKLQKKHDRETAERLSKEFSKKLDELKNLYDADKESYEAYKRKVEDLFRVYGIAF